MSVRTTGGYAGAAWALAVAGVPAALLIGSARPAAASPGYVLGVLICVLAGAAGLLHNVAAGHRRPWLLVLAAQALSAASEIVHLATGQLPGLLVLPDFLLLMAAAVDLFRRSRAGADDPARVDALLVGAGSALLVWSLWIEPWASGADPRWQNLIAAVLPLAAALLLIIVLPVLLLGRRRTPALWFLATAVLALLGGTIVLAARGWFVAGPGGIPLKAMGAVVLLADAAFAACLLHPSVRFLTQRVPGRSRHLRAGRIATITAALCVPTAVDVIAPPSSTPFALVRAALSLALIGLVVARVVRANNSRDRAEQEAHWRSEHDALTGLPNRERLAAAVEAWPGDRITVLLLDLDRFKVINDQWGHEVGDELLRAVATRISGAVRDTDLVCRVGGDEFVVAVADEDGRELAGRLITAVAAPLALSVGRVDVTTSIGVASAAGPCRAVDLLRDADTAMYRAKDSGRNQIAAFDLPLRERLQRRFAIERAFRGALGGGELAVHYQPIVRLATGQTDGFEALMRWTHPGLGAVSPVEFIPVAEDTGMIVEAGAWLLEDAAGQVRAWRDDEVSELPLHISVNLAVRQLHEPGLVAAVRAVLDRTGLPAAALWLEVTESGFMTDPDACMDTLQALKDLGITLCIDDFGTGYSSLSYLQRLPVGIVKIDRAFIAGVGDGCANESIVRSVLAMAHALGHRVVAEGVETETQHAWLRDNGCDFGQGWLYGRPLAGTDQTTRLRTVAATR